MPDPFFFARCIPSVSTFSPYLHHKMSAKSAAALEAQVKELEAKVKAQEATAVQLRQHVKQMELARAGDQKEKSALQRTYSENVNAANAKPDEALLLINTVQVCVHTSKASDVCKAPGAPAGAGSGKRVSYRTGGGGIRSAFREWKFARPPLHSPHRMRSITGADVGGTPRGSSSPL